MLICVQLKEIRNLVNKYKLGQEVDEDGDTLREYTHMEPPWKMTRGDLKDGESGNKDIPDELMMEYYHN